MPTSVYFPQNIFKSNTSSVYSPYCLRFSMPPGEGAAKIGTSFSNRNGIISIPNEYSRGYSRELAVPLLYVYDLAYNSLN